MKQKQPTQDISRKEAAKLLNDVMLELSKFIHDEAPNAERFFLKLEGLVESAGLQLPKPCTGEAHNNPFIDNCGVCLNFKWEWIGKPVKVK